MFVTVNGGGVRTEQFPVLTPGDQISLEDIVGNVS